MINAYEISVVKFQREVLMYRRKWDYNIKMNVKNIWNMDTS
jgi:hypothetical protein